LFWKSQEELAPTWDRQVVGRTHSLATDLLGHDPLQFALPADAKRLVKPSLEWFRNRSMLVWIAPPGSQLRHTDLGLANVDFLLVGGAHDPTLLLKQRDERRNITLNGINLAEIHPDGEITLWGHEFGAT
jgi:hypothetical protein